MTATDRASIPLVVNGEPVEVSARHSSLLGALREELGALGVHVGTVCPGRVDTGYLANNNADIDWFPRIAKVFPTSEPDDVAVQVIRSLRTRRREIIFPFLLRFFVSCYQLSPAAVLWLLKALQLFRPVRGQEA